MQQDAAWACGKRLVRRIRRGARDVCWHPAVFVLVNGELAGGDGVAQGVEQTLRLLGELRRGFGGEAQLLVSGSCFPLGLLGQPREE